ncbi:MSC_0618 family F1-like ATPase beta subunit [Mycoplasma struthionis]|uniref:F0F1 ATP synthase subunit beta n=1 Tax=Mycoplasma struthionis TaxID=538220 RepID=A0A3G8LIX8_9MOLU|nr:F0F1 ATP synthase subunit beta [Mycoplasma struthionis]AZG68618.1 F0F1 ATP synthase subunit beta [Mycoplasma struthionis]
MAKITKIWTDVVEINFNKSNMPKINDILLKKDKTSSFMVKKIVDDETVYAMIIRTDGKIQINDEITNTKSSFMVPVGKKAKNNIFDVDGVSQNNANSGFDYVEMNSTIIENSDYAIKPELMETGIKAIDFFIPILKGAKIGIFGGAGVGKTVLMKEIIFKLSNTQQNTSSIFIGSGERSREGVELYNDLKESNLMKNSSMYIAKMNETAGARMSIVPVGVTAAEYARDVNKENVLLFIDNIFRFLQAGNEISASLDKKPSLGGYQATMNTEISQIQNRLFTNKNGAITSFQTVFLPMDDLSDPSAVAIFNHLNGSLVLSREVSAKNIFPAFDALASSSATVNPLIIGKKHYEAILETKKILQKYKELEDVILILGVDELDDASKIVVKKALQLQNFFSQYFFMTEYFTHEKGQYVPLNETVDSVVEIIEGKYIDVHPSEFLYIGSTKDLKIVQPTPIVEEASQEIKTKAKK